MNRTATPSRSLLFERLEAPLAPLDRLPRGLWLGSLIHSQGALVPQAARGIERLREALLAGACPRADGAHWPPPTLAAGLHATFVRLELPGHCRGRDET